MTSIFNALRMGMDKREDLKVKCDSQSLAFYSDIASFIGRHIPGYKSLSLLDVGARTAAGTALLRAIHHPQSFARIKLHPVTALDLDAATFETAREEYRDIDYLVADVGSFAGQRSWDIVLTSHTIEHVSDPDGFLRALEATANQYVIVACPFAEEPPLIPGHLQRFNLEFFERNGFTTVETYRSLHWHQSMACMAIKTKHS